MEAVLKYGKCNWDNGHLCLSLLSRHIRKNILSLCCIFATVAIFFLTASNGKAEEITLEEALRLFYKNNYDILINRYEIDKAYADFISAKLLPNPNLSFSGIGLKTHGLPRRSDDTQLTAKIDQLIELGGKRKLRKGAAMATLEATKLSHQDLIRTLIIGFYTGYYNLQLDRLNVEFARYDLGRFDKTQEVAERRFAAGFLSLIDYTKIKVARIDLENSLTNFEKQSRADLESFNFLIASETALEPSKLTMQETLAEYNEGSLIETALKNRHDLLSLQKQSEAAQKSISLAKAQAIPDITLGGEYDAFGADSRPRVGAEISFPLPLFNRNQGEVLKKKAEYKQLEEEIKKTKRQITSDIRQSLNNYHASLKIFDAYKAREKEVEDLLNKSETAFSLGGITVLDLLDARKTYRDFVTKYHQGLVQMLLNQELIKLYTGEIK